MSTLLVCALAVVLVGGGSYWIANKFWSSGFAGTNTSGDHGGPRGGVFAMLLPAIIGLCLFLFVGKYIFPAEAVGVGAVVALIAGIVGAFAGSFAAVFSKFKDNEKKDK